MKILVTGVKGQLGYDVIRVLEQTNIEHIGVDIEDFDITDKQETYKYIKDYNPTAIIHCSAYTSVDKAEDEVEKCMNINVNGTRNIASVCKKIGAKMLYISTDYIFEGIGDNFYEVDDMPGPTSIYGRSKLDGENVIKELLDNYFIIRISWAFGINGNNFVKSMLRLGKDHNEIKVVDDQVGSPTYTKDLAGLLCEIIKTEKYGIYHATNEGICTWAEFATEIFKEVGYSTKVSSISSEEFGAKAIRPKNSRLSKEVLINSGFKTLPHWKDALKRYLKEIEVK